MRNFCLVYYRQLINDSPLGLFEKPPSHRESTFRITFRIKMNCCCEGDIIVMLTLDQFQSFLSHSIIFIRGCFQVHALIRFHFAILIMVSFTVLGFYCS